MLSLWVWIKAPWKALVLSKDTDHNVSGVRGVAMLKQKNSLPSAECQLSLQDGNHLARPRQSHPQVARHVIRSLMGMDKIRRFFWCKAIKKRMKICAG
jgi:hypothetical protein